MAATLIAAGEGLSKIAIYFVYEEFWKRLRFGRYLMNNDGCCIWLTGLSGSGKTTIALELKKELEKRLQRVEYLDGDIVRKSFTGDLGFSKEDRDENIRRVSYVASYLSRHAITICAFISPYRAARDKARAIGNNFIEVFVDCPLEECERRDVKGMYKKARAGEIKQFTGISDPYEAPTAPEIVVHTDKETLEQSVQTILQYLEQHQLLSS